MCMKTYFVPSRFTSSVELSLLSKGRLAILRLQFRPCRALCPGRVGCAVPAPTKEERKTQARKLYNKIYMIKKKGAQLGNCKRLAKECGGSRTNGRRDGETVVGGSNLWDY